MTAILMILAGAVVAMAMQNRRLSSQIAALLDRQEQAEQKLDRLSKTSRKQTSRQRKYEHKLEVQRKKQALPNSKSKSAKSRPDRPTH